MNDLLTLRQRLGGAIYDGGRRWVGPGPGHGRKDGSLSVMIGDGGRMIFHSFANDAPEAIRAHLGLLDTQERRQSPQDRRREQEARQRQAAADQARKLSFCQGIWEASSPAGGSPVEAYLRGRGITIPIPGVLRFHPGAPLGYTATVGAPSMVAMVQDANGKPCGLHTTAIMTNGSGKAAMTTTRRMFGAVVGGSVRLAPGPQGGVLAAAEGIETALAYSQLTGATSWACLSAIGLERVIVPPGLTRLLVAADNDDAGMKAARSLAERAARRCAWKIDFPPTVGMDWNDVLVAEIDQ